MEFIFICCINFSYLSDFETLRQWEQNIKRIRTTNEIEAFEKTESDFFKKLYRKNKVLYTEIDYCNEFTVDQINSGTIARAGALSCTRQSYLLATN